MAVEEWKDYGEFLNKTFQKKTLLLKKKPLKKWDKIWTEKNSDNSWLEHSKVFKVLMSQHLRILVKEEEVHTEEEVNMDMEEEVEEEEEDMVMENIVTFKEDIVTVTVQEVEAEVEEDQEDTEEDMEVVVDLVPHLAQADHQVLEEEEEDIEVMDHVVDHLEWWKNSSVDLWVDHTKENSEKLKDNSFKIWKPTVPKKNS